MPFKERLSEMVHSFPHPTSFHDSWASRCAVEHWVLKSFAMHW